MFSKFYNTFFTSIVVLGIGLISFQLKVVHEQYGKIEQPIKYWAVVLNPWNKNDNLRTMKRVMNRFGYQEVNGNQTEWDILWMIEFPFDKTTLNLSHLKQHQKVNHIPGMTFLTNKLHLTTTTKSKYIPPAFQFPKMIKEFKEFNEINPDTMFVEKNFDNRGVKIVEKSEINFDMKSKYVQQFVGNPLLIDGRVFDFGIYVLISSVNPLRIYRYKQEVLPRFCPEPYYPFDPNNIEKYVIYETHIPVWKMPSLKTYINKLGFSFKTSIETHLAKRGYNVIKMWEQIDDAIVSLVLSKEHHFINNLKQFHSQHNFFELLRFDFIMDAEMNVYLMEVNMSPNLTPTNEKFENYSLGYEQLIFNTMKTIGAGSYGEMKQRSREESKMFSSGKNIAVNALFCSESCNKSCFSAGCELCLSCMNGTGIKQIHRSYREHMNRGEMKRIFPNNVHFQEEIIKQMTPANQFMTNWFHAKCQEDKSWCS